MDRISYSPFVSLNLERFLRAYLSPALFRRGEILEQLGRPGEATAAYRLFAQLWRQADLEFQSMVAEAGKRMQRLASQAPENQ